MESQKPSVPSLLYDEVCKRFPEAQGIFSGNEDLPYVVLGLLADWLGTLEESKLTPEMIQRIVDLDDWSIKQPRGETAADDIVTIWIVAFYEKLFEHEKLRHIIPKFSTKEDLLQNRDYLITWVGKDNYEAALKEFHTHAK